MVQFVEDSPFNFLNFFRLCLILICFPRNDNKHHLLTQQMKRHTVIVALRPDYNDLEPARFLNVAHLFVKVHKETDAYSIAVVKHKMLAKGPDKIMKTPNVYQNCK